MDSKDPHHQRKQRRKRGVGDIDQPTISLSNVYLREFSKKSPCSTLVLWTTMSKQGHRSIKPIIDLSSSKVKKKALAKWLWENRGLSKE